MARECVLCGKNRASGNNVSHSVRRTKRTFKPNLQKIDVDGNKEYVCTRCLRTMKKVD